MSDERRIEEINEAFQGENFEEIYACECSGNPVIRFKSGSLFELVPHSVQHAGGTAMAIRFESRKKKEGGGIHSPGSFSFRRRA